MSRKRDIAYGRHSLIPECCITFFVDHWNNLWKDSVYKGLIHMSDYNYVPCPKCFYMGRKVKIINCERDCKRECWKEFGE
jgi:hypothetical protein